MKSLLLFEIYDWNEHNIIWLKMLCIEIKIKYLNIRKSGIYIHRFSVNINLRFVKFLFEVHILYSDTFWTQVGDKICPKLFYKYNSPIIKYYQSIFLLFYYKLW